MLRSDTWKGNRMRPFFTSCSLVFLMGPIIFGGCVTTQGKTTEAQQQKVALSEETQLRLAATRARARAEQGSLRDQYRLAANLLDSDYGRPNIAEAEQWFNKAVVGYKELALKGDRDAQTQLGFMHQCTTRQMQYVYYQIPSKITYRGVDASRANMDITKFPAYAEAERWFLMAAKDGGEQELLNLAEYYDPGISVHPSADLQRKKALPIYRQLAKIGNQYAQIMLSEKYFYGNHGVNKDLNESLKWARLAHENNAPGVTLFNQKPFATSIFERTKDAIRREESERKDSRSGKPEADKVKPYAIGQNTKAKPQAMAVGQQICMRGTGEISSRCVVNNYTGERYCNKSNGTFELRGFVESIHAAKIKIQISGMKSTDSGTYATAPLDGFDYNGNQIRNGSVLWDDADQWSPC